VSRDTDSKANNFFVMDVLDAATDVLAVIQRDGSVDCNDPTVVDLAEAVEAYRVYFMKHAGPGEQKE
jgi:hypothetical protein